MKAYLSLPLRLWLTITLVLVVMSPIVTWFTSVVAVLGHLKTRPTSWERQAQVALQQSVQLIEDQQQNWGSPSFQQNLAVLLEPGGLSVVLLSPEGRTIYQNGPLYDFPLQLYNPNLQQGQEKTLLSSFGYRQYLGQARDENGIVTGIYMLVQTEPDPTWFIFLAVAVIGLTVSTALAVWWVGRSIGNPIRILAQAAQQVNRGELAFEVPVSRVKELNELAAAFSKMRDGLRSSILQQVGMEQERRILIAAIAHDLRTPLTSVRGYLEGLRDGVAHSPEKIQRYITVALEKTGTLERLVQNLFTYTKTEYLQQPPQLEEFDLGSILTESVNSLLPQAMEKKVVLVLDDNHRQTGKLYGDKLMIGRIVDNLLDNALRNTPPGGTVTVGWQYGTEVCNFYVHDTGPGIPEEDLSRVFLPLYRGDKSRDPSTGGAGLGLAIAKRLVEVHGGDIAVISKAGALFTVTLPYRR